MNSIPPKETYPVLITPIRTLKIQFCNHLFSGLIKISQLNKFLLIQYI